MNSALNNMIHLRDKIAQLLIVGFHGTDLKAAAPIRQAIEQDHLGGVILFDRDWQRNQLGRNITDPDQLKALTSELHAANTFPLPLLIAVDYEGGEVTRLTERDGFLKTHSPKFIAEQGLPFAKDHYTEMATTLSEAGCNLNFAPTVDLLYPDNMIIAGKNRAYSADPAEVVAFSQCFIQAFREKGVLCCLKHFPGHGSSEADSHLDFTDISQTWHNHELEPYRRLLALGLADLIMTAHVFHQQLDPLYPATLSKAILIDLLRKEMGFDGVVISDDLQMAAIAKQYTLRESMIASINAGCDLLIIGNQLAREAVSPQTLIDDLCLAHQKGEIKTARIEEAYQRIEALKAKLR